MNVCKSFIFISGNCVEDFKIRIFIWEACREMDDRESSVTHSLSKCLQWSKLADKALELKNSVQVSQVDDRGTTDALAITCCFPQCSFAGSWNVENSRNSNTGTSTWQQLNHQAKSLFPNLKSHCHLLQIHCCGVYGILISPEKWEADGDIAYWVLQRK